MQIKSLYCLFADFVLQSLITPGFIYSFLYMCIFQCHRRAHFGVKDLTLFVAEGSGLYSPAPVLCRKSFSVENNLLHHTDEMEVAGGLLVHRLLKMSNPWPWAENWGEGAARPQQAQAGMVAMREAEAKPHLRQGTWRV